MVLKITIIVMIIILVHTHTHPYPILPPLKLQSLYRVSREPPRGCISCHRNQVHLMGTWKKFSVEIQETQNIVKNLETSSKPQMGFSSHFFSDITSCSLTFFWVGCGESSGNGLKSCRVPLSLASMEPIFRDDYDTRWGFP